MKAKKLFRVLLMLISLTVLSSGLIFAKTELFFQHMNTVPNSQKVIDEAIEEFEAAHPDVEIKEVLVTWGEAHSQFMLSLTVGMAPDLVMLGGPWAPEFMRMGAFAPVDEYVSEEVLDIFLPTGLSLVKDDDHLYGVPWEGGTWAFFYRKDLFEEVGLDPESPPQDWEELVEYAQKLTEGDRYGLVFPAAGWEASDFYLPFIWQTGSDIVKKAEDGNWEPQFSSETVRTGTQFYYDLVNKYEVVSQSITSMDWESAKNAFVSGKAAMMYNGMWVVNTIKESNPELDGKWATAVNPAGPSGVKASLGYPNTLHITAQSRNKELAAEFIELFYGGESPTYADRYAMSVTSLNWTKPFMKLPFTQDELIQPFVETMLYSQSQPTTPKFEDFRNLYLVPALQSLILDKITPDEFAEEMDKMFRKLHQ